MLWDWHFLWAPAVVIYVLSTSWTYFWLVAIGNSLCANPRKRDSAYEKQLNLKVWFPRENQGAASKKLQNTRYFYIFVRCVADCQASNIM